MKDKIYEIIERNYRGMIWRSERRRNGMVFVKDKKNILYLHIYKIRGGIFLCNGCLMREGNIGRPFFMDKKEQFICYIYYDEERDKFKERDIIELLCNMNKYYIRLYILPKIGGRERKERLKLLSFYKLSTKEIEGLRNYYIFFNI